MNPYLKLLMEKPGQIPERGSNKTPRWIRKSRRYGRLLKREGRRLQAEIEAMESELDIRVAETRVIREENAELRLAMYAQKSQSFYAQVNGALVHISGDPDMSDETFDALVELAKLAIRAIESGEIGGMMKEVKLICPVCGGEMRTDHTVGNSFEIDDDPHGFHSTEWFAEMWDCPKGCCYAEDWYFDEEHRDFYEGAVRNNQTYWYHPDTEEEIKKDDDHMVREMGPG